ncbi:hypothetical protein KQI65_14505 [bacterium]|nr:hypothetical protein [bacterium]
MSRNIMWSKRHNIFKHVCAAAVLVLLTTSCESPLDPDTPRIRITEPTPYFLRTFNFSLTMDREVGQDVLQLDDGGYIITGSVTTADTKSADVMLLRTDAEGHKMWLKTYGGVKSDIGYSVAQASDGGFVIAGQTETFGEAPADMWIIKTDANGTMEWLELRGGVGRDIAQDIIPSSSGGYLVTGWIDDINHGANYLYASLIDERGKDVWVFQPTGMNRNDRGLAALETAEEDFVVVGSTPDTADAGLSDIWLINIDGGDGSVNWSRMIGAPDNLEGVDIAQTMDGGFAIAANKSTVGSNNKNIYVVKTDSAGNVLSRTVLSEPSVSRSIKSCSDGGFVLCGYTNPLVQTSSDILLLRFAADGSLLWKKKIGGEHIDQAHGVEVTLEGGYILTGTTQSYGSGTEDVLLLKTDENGNYKE